MATHKDRVSLTSVTKPRACESLRSRMGAGPGLGAGSRSRPAVPGERGVWQDPSQVSHTRASTGSDFLRGPPGDLKCAKQADFGVTHI